MTQINLSIVITNLLPRSPQDLLRKLSKIYAKQSSFWPKTERCVTLSRDCSVLDFLSLTVLYSRYCIAKQFVMWSQEQTHSSLISVVVQNDRYIYTLNATCVAYSCHISNWKGKNVSCLLNFMWVTKTFELVCALKSRIKQTGHST